MLRTDLKTTTKWFYIRKSEEYHDYGFEELIRTCLEINSKVNSAYEDLSINYNVDKSLYLKGHSFYYLYDIINILYSNAVKHSGINKFSDIEIDVSAKCFSHEETLEYLKDELPPYYESWKEMGKKNPSNNTLFLKFSNNLSHSINQIELHKKVKSVVNMFNNYDESKKFVSKEGGTGLIKIHTILQFNLVTPYYVHVYYADNYKFYAEIFINLDQIITTKGSES